MLKAAEGRAATGRERRAYEECEGDEIVDDTFRLPPAVAHPIADPIAHPALTSTKPAAAKHAAGTAAARAATAATAATSAGRCDDRPGGLSKRLRPKRMQEVFAENWQREEEEGLLARPSGGGEGALGVGLCGAGGLQERAPGGGVPLAPA